MKNKNITLIFTYIKNVYGFECLMVPYVVDHLKPSQYLKEKFVAATSIMRI
ncbi:hypothetical protein [Borreliella carolinensis]|uniref:Uncharacterized protein n=1 Tax=Borreliella carolinensis TaxID=478174 RepID=A0ACD5GKW2_9SPIR